MNKSIGNPKQAGFSMIEVLVTMVIVALGLLGFAGLQTYSLKSNRTSLQRSLATMYAYEIVDCMRVNRPAAIALAYNLDFNSPAVTGTVAGNDMDAWKDALADSLPNGVGKVTVAAGNVTVEIRWTENNDASSNTLTFSTETTI